MEGGVIRQLHCSDERGADPDIAWGEVGTLPLWLLFSVPLLQAVRRWMLGVGLLWGGTGIIQGSFISLLPCPDKTL